MVQVESMETDGIAERGGKTGSVAYAGCVQMERLAFGQKGAKCK
jgi:hypothetical protein